MTHLFEVELNRVKIGLSKALATIKVFDVSLLLRLSRIIWLSILKSLFVFDVQFY